MAAARRRRRTAPNDPVTQGTTLYREQRSRLGSDIVIIWYPNDKLEAMNRADFITGTGASQDSPISQPAQAGAFYLIRVLDFSGQLEILEVSVDD
jgi:hypothetical protein